MGVGEVMVVWVWVRVELEVSMEAAVRVWRCGWVGLGVGVETNEGVCGRGVGWMGWLEVAEVDVGASCRLTHRHVLSMMSFLLATTLRGVDWGSVLPQYAQRVPLYVQ
mmetsp:Transcript_61383/g.136753  ORF Transcript_61383/g.136753 Transcript_61383/m.136753 type:complete len:108 (+) Transcript_61383:246-569(+)